MGWLWAALFVVGAVAEIIALLRKQPGDTLSENVRRVLVRRRIRWATLAGWVAFALWFAWHIWF